MKIYHWNRKTDTLTVVPKLISLSEEERIIARSPVTCKGVTLFVRTEFAYVGDFFEPDAVFATCIYRLNDEGVNLLSRWYCGSSTSAKKCHDVAVETLREHGADFVARLQKQYPERFRQQPQI